MSRLSDGFGNMFMFACVFAGMTMLALPGCQSAISTPVPSPQTTDGVVVPAQANSGPDAPASSLGTQKSIVDIVADLTPSVVHIQTEIVQIDSFNRAVPGRGVGTGEIISGEGHILTNNHVIEGAERIIVTLADDRVFEGELIGRDPATDLAILKIEADGLVPIQFGNSAELKVGDPVLAIGHALDLPGGPTVTGGLVSALNRSIDISPTTTIRDLIQTDAAINPGNSGGPLVDRDGLMVGINTAKVPTADGIGFSIAIDESRVLIAELISEGRIDRGFLGVSVSNVTEALAMSQRLSVSKGAFVVSVVPDSPAETAGLKQGHIIVRLAGQEVTKSADLATILTDYRHGATVLIEYVHGANRQTAKITLGSRPD